jgi:hypothetical protein
MTLMARYLDPGFTHGIAIGDFNDDGFPDIFDANYGRNRLYRNNGDGTFSDATAEVGLQGEFWTTSAVIADIDNDGFADLYEVAYCTARKPIEDRCRNEQGRIVTCSPLRFTAQTDRVFAGRGDGSFADVTDAWMDQTSPGRGLGIVAGRFDERAGLDLYIANDMTANHLWSADHTKDRFRLADLGVVRGVGMNSRSLSQASMGIAAADPDGDGDIDFFLTHFSKDHNTYYEQVAPGLWADRSFQVGLVAPSMNLLGFGTEWIDFDNNATPELIIANGHIDDLKDIPFRMPAQVFQQDQRGRWLEMDRNDLGEYFAGDHLGRALVSVDVNRDGLIDVAITHLQDPVSLLINQTEDAGGLISFQLKSTSGQRDAIGASLTAQLADRQVTGQLTAGDGYMCSRQRRITFGTAGESELRDVVVVWPSGRREPFGTVRSGADYLLVEGSGQAFELGTHR